MKTKPLREHLLDRSRAADVEDGLAAMRERVLAAAAGASVSRPRAGQTHVGPLDALRTLWRELVAPCRGLWATLAAAWLAVLFLNATERPVDGEKGRLSSVDSTAWAAVWRERQRRFVEPVSYYAGFSPVEPVGPRRPDARPTASPPKPLGWHLGPASTVGFCRPA